MLNNIYYNNALPKDRETIQDEVIGDTLEYSIPKKNVSHGLKKQTLIKVEF